MEKKMEKWQQILFPNMLSVHRLSPVHRRQGETDRRQK